MLYLELTLSLVEKGFLANDWIEAISSLTGGEGGGSRTSAQASGTNIDRVSEILEKANKSHLIFIINSNDG